MRLALIGLAVLVLLALAAPLLVAATGLPAPDFRDTSSLSPAFGTPTGPGAEHLFGVDQLGRDVLSRTLFGARASLLIVVAATALTMLIGVTLGMAAGYRGGVLDLVISRLIETVLVIPYLLLAIGIAASCSGEQGCLGGTVKPGVPLVIAVIAIASWPTVARVVRSQTLAIRHSDFVTAAKLSGMGEGRILAREVLPNLGGTVTVLAVVMVPQVFIAEASLSFLGIGVPPAIATWGGMISEAVPLFPESWWYMLLPGAALFATVLATTVVADGVRDSQRS